MAAEVQGFHFRSPGDAITADPQPDSTNNTAKNPEFLRISARIMDLSYVLHRPLACTSPEHCHTPLLGSGT